MNDVIYINNFLDKSYRVVTSQTDFSVEDIMDNKKMVFSDFKKIFLKLFGEFNVDDQETSLTIVNSWFRNKKRIVSAKLYDIFDELDDCQTKSQLLLDKIKDFCDLNHKYEYHHEFITNLFLSYYKDKYITPKLEEYVKGLNNEINSVKLINDFQEEFILEHHKLISYMKEYLNDWYSKTIIGDKVSDLLSQLVLTLGSRNWVVTWIGHGPFSKKRLLEKFVNENHYHHDFILKMYDKWYEDAVIEASEKAMGRSLGIFRNGAIRLM